MSGAPLDGTVYRTGHRFGSLCGAPMRLRRSGADVLHGHQPADDNNRVTPDGGRHSLLTLTGRNSCR
jgi:hypothetical protein